MLDILLMLAAVAVVGLVVVVVRQPEDFRVSRSATMAAPAAVVFEQVNDLHKWEAWSPWAKLDPEARNDFEGPGSGVGAVMRWVGNSKVGEGSMTIIESRPSDLVVFKLEFIKPLKSASTAEFIFKSEGNQTVVTWSMYGKNNFIGKAIGVLMNCEKMVVGQFEQGLSAIKSIVESVG